jgi:hypothetical protein
MKLSNKQQRDTKMSEFQYLGPIITCDNNIDVEVNHRITTENKCFYGMQNLLRSKLLINDTVGTSHSHRQPDSFLRPQSYRWPDSFDHSQADKQTPWSTDTA